jgi:hypothetical protein
VTRVFCLRKLNQKENGENRKVLRYCYAPPSSFQSLQSVNLNHDNDVSETPHVKRLVEFGACFTLYIAVSNLWVCSTCHFMQGVWLEMVLS